MTEEEVLEAVRNPAYGHIVLELLEKLVNRLEEFQPDAELRILVDISERVDPRYEKSIHDHQL